jgi:predicted ATPase
VALVERAGEVVSKDELAARAWPGTFVEESNLRVHIAGLRRALHDGKDGSRFIVNVPGRGYSFVAAVSDDESSKPTSAREAAREREFVIPAALTDVIGRTDVVEMLATVVPQRRFVTVVGPSGIGKTTVALAVARKLAPSYRDGVAFVDFAAAAGDEVVTSALCGALGVPVAAADTLAAVTAFLQHKQMLLLFDSCEHVIEGVAGAAEEVASSVPGVHILATSLEPLRAAGETVHRLLPLATPAVAQGQTAAEAMTFAAVRLLVERASASLDGFELTDADAPFAGEICRRLDGIALAIELAAGRVAVFGMRDLAARLDDRFRLLTSGRRTALPRHQTLRATLDWSYELLTDSGQRLLRRLAVFSGEFTLDAAAAMIDGDVFSELAELVAKSLVTANLFAEHSRYRLLDSTRLYGLERLRQAEEFDAARDSHATYVNRLFGQAASDGETMPPQAWLAIYRGQVDNIRAALDWAEAAPGGARLFVELTVRAVLLWVQLSMMSECQARVERALALLGSVEGERDRKTCEMRLRAALGWALMYGAGRADTITASWARTLELAEELGNPSYRSRGLWGMWMGRLNNGDWAAALDLARQLAAVVATGDDAQDVMMADRLLATTLHYRGEQADAQRYMERMLARYALMDSHPRVSRLQVDQKVTAHYFLARILWLRGRFDEARRTVELNIEEERALGHALTYCSVLGQAACPIAFYTGDLDSARRYAAMLREHAERFRFRLWHDWASCFEGAVAARRGDLTGGLELMRTALERAGDGRFLPRYMILLGEYAACRGQSGDVEAGLRTIEDLIARCERSEERWFIPEAMRIKSELILVSGAATIAEAVLARAAELARLQDARAWELRVLISRAQIRREHVGNVELDPELAALLASFPSDVETADLHLARSIVQAETAPATRRQGAGVTTS